MGIFLLIAFLLILLYGKTTVWSQKEACIVAEISHTSSQSKFRSDNSVSAVQVLGISGLFLATVKIKHPRWFLSVINSVWHSGHITLILLWTPMSVNEFPQKQTAVLPYRLPMWSCFPHYEKINGWADCLYYSTFSTVQYLALQSCHASFSIRWDWDLMAETSNQTGKRLVLTGNST